MSARAGRRAGFTLIEAMVVVVIVGILSGVAVSYLGGERDLDDVVGAAANLVRESSRAASERGPVPADAVALGETSQVRIRIQRRDGAQLIGREALVRDGTALEWVELDAVSLPHGMELHGMRRAADVTGGLGPDVIVAADDELIRCYPNGACDAATLYFQHDDEQMRLVIMPLHGAPRAFGGW